MTDVTLLELLMLIPVAIFAGAVNSIAGGGTFFTFPILILMGMPPIIANTTNKVGIALASVAGVAGFWKEIKVIRSHLAFFTLAALVGSVVGSLLLLAIPSEQFRVLVPWLMLAATLMFAFGGKWVQRRAAKSPTTELPVRRPFTGIGQFLIGVYGGFFAAGMGILMLGLYEMAGMKNIHEMNALKVVVALGINLISAAVFLFAGTVDWTIAGILIVGALIGGYGGAMLSKKLPQKRIRQLIVIYGIGMTTYFFIAG